MVICTVLTNKSAQASTHRSQRTHTDSTTAGFIGHQSWLPRSSGPPEYKGVSVVQCITITTGTVRHAQRLGYNLAITDIITIESDHAICRLPRQARREVQWQFQTRWSAWVLRGRDHGAKRLVMARNARFGTYVRSLAPGGSRAPSPGTALACEASSM